jgi:hypothetical protein
MSGRCGNERRDAHRVRARDVGTPATLGTFASTDHESRMMVVNLGRLAPWMSSHKEGAAGAVGDYKHHEN